MARCRVGGIASPSRRRFARWDCLANGIPAVPSCSAVIAKASSPGFHLTIHRALPTLSVDRDIA
jgi:hypothetical protein